MPTHTFEKDKPMTEFHIREARADDKAEIETLTISAYQEYAPVMQANWERYRHSILGTLADVGPAEQIVAEQDGALVGTVLLFPAATVLTRPDGGTATLTWPEIRLLAVSPSVRGQGIGAALVRECMRRAREAGAEAVTLHTTDMMAVAM